MNTYLRNLNRIEFTVTMACTGKCIHCSEGGHAGFKDHIDAKAACDAVRKICGHYDITSLMTFGGEPLLYPETICEIHKTAAELHIAKRQLITNGYFTKDRERAAQVASDLAASKVNDLLLSVDAFHQETIPLEPVLFFAKCAVEAGVPVRLSPAWLVSPEDDNPYNVKTREVLRKFESLNIPLGNGNVIFPSGNALKYLSEYFDTDVQESTPYDDDPYDIRAISFDPNGDVLNGNVYQTDIMEIIRTYSPV